MEGYRGSGMMDRKTENQNTSVPVFSQRLCGLLLTRGFVLQGMTKKKKDESKNVFYFVDSDALREAIMEYSSVKI
jgi:hypothetical protein